MTPQRVIGSQGELPWHLSDDLRRFKRLTMGHYIVMGRKTYDSIGRLLPGRRSIVISRQVSLAIPGADVVNGIAEALQLSAKDPETFLIGGEQIYQAGLPHANRIYLTRVQADVTGDAYFPELIDAQWQLRHEEQFPASEKNQFDSTFQILERI